jgi:hypothetical protein
VKLTKLPVAPTGPAPETALTATVTLWYGHESTFEHFELPEIFDERSISQLAGSFFLL